MDLNQIGQEYILDSRIRGERKIAGIRLILLIPLTGFVFLIFFGHVAETGINQALTDFAFWVELVCIIMAALMSLWVFKITKQRRYYTWMKYLLPFIDISFITLIISSIVRPPFSGVLFTSASPYLYFIFICTCVLRSSPASVIFTGVYSTLSYIGLWFYAVNGLGILGRWTTDFTNEYGTVSIMMDDEIIKPLVFLVVTAVLAYVANWFNRLIIEQIKMSTERNELRDIFTKDLKEVTVNVNNSSDTLLTTSQKFTEGIEQMRESADKIDQETKEEFTAVEQTSATIIQMIKSIESVTKNIQTQVGQVQSIVASIQEMGAAIKHITQTSKSADQIALNLLNAAEDGENTMEQVVNVIKQTEEASKRVEEIVEMISSIAGTTDLLSMNAAIEAAHAGVAGRGFAVVADEIRKLAETTSDNARMIAQILKDMLERISQVVTLSDKASASLKSILNDAKQTSDINSEVLHAMEEESATVNEVVQAIQILSNITEEVKQASEEQAIGSNEILTAINHIRSRANQVSSLTEVQAKKNKEIEAINQELSTLVANNSQIIEKLDNLVSKL